MKTITASQALELEIVETPLNCEFKQIDINGQYAATVGKSRAIPTWENLLSPFVDLSNGMQVDFAPEIKLFHSSHGTEGTVYNISMPYKTIELGGRETKCRIQRQGSFNSSKGDTFGMAMYVQICSNGMMGWKNDAANSAQTRFSTNWQTISNSRISAMLQNFDGMADHYIALAEILKEKTINANQLETFLTKKFKGNHSITTRKRDQLSELFVTGKGNSGENAWDLFNAFTEFENHHKTFRTTKGVSAAESREKNVLTLDTDSIAKELLAIV
jgi:hypothetical protein